jgi:hypothetical protein
MNTMLSSGAGGKRLAFGVTVYREPPTQLDDCLARVRAVYERESVFVISDGNDDRGYRECCRRHRAGYYPGERLKVATCGAQWWQRFFEIALARPADFVFKMDADTWLHRPFAGFPKWDVFGTVDRDFEIQGGMQGFRRSTVQKIVTSGICLDPVYKDPARWGPPRTVKYTQSTGQISSDHSLAHIVRRLGLTWGDWAEVDCQWRKSREFRDGVAASHPHKEWNRLAAFRR